MYQMPPAILKPHKMYIYQRNQQNVEKTLIAIILTKNASFKSCGTFSYLLCRISTI